MRLRLGLVFASSEDSCDIRRVDRIEKQNELCGLVGDE